MRRQLVTLATALLVLTGCSSGSDQSTAGKALDKVTFVTAVQANGRGADVFVADKKGYYKDAGIAVDIVLGSSVEKNMGSLTSGKAMFAEFDSTGAIIQIGRQSFTDVRMIAAIHTRMLPAIISLDPAIATPKDLAGRKLGVAPGGVNEMLFPTYAKLAGLDPRTVKVVRIASNNQVAALVEGKVDALSTFLVQQSNIETAAGKAGRTPRALVMPYTDYIGDAMGNALATSTAVIDKDPDLVRRFRDATLKGLRYTVDHPEEAADILHAAQPATSAAAALGEIRAMGPYVTPTDGVLGAIPESRVAKIIALCRSLDLFAPEIQPAAVVDFSLTPTA